MVAKAEYSSSPFSISTAATAKISVLCLYRRIFPTPSFRRKSLIVGVGVICYWITSVTVSIFGCRPIRAAWETTPHSFCVNTLAFFLALELYNCLLDVAILSLPVREVRKLQMPLKQKVAVATIFLLGGLLVALLHNTRRCL